MNGEVIWRTGERMNGEFVPPPGERMNGEFVWRPGERRNGEFVRRPGKFLRGSSEHVGQVHEQGIRLLRPPRDDVPKSDTFPAAATDMIAVQPLI